MPPLPKTCPKTVCPRKGVAFLWKAFFQKKFSDTLSMRIMPLRAVAACRRSNHPAAHESEGPWLSLRQPKRSDLRPPVPYSCSVLREAGLSLEDLGPRLKTCQRGSLGDHGPVSGDGLTSQRQDLVFSCLAPLHRRGMRLMEEGGRGKTP